MCVCVCVCVKISGLYLYQQPDRRLAVAAQLGCANFVCTIMGTGSTGQQLHAYGRDAHNAQSCAPCALRVPVERRKHYARGVRNRPPSALCTVAVTRTIHWLLRHGKWHRTTTPTPSYPQSYSGKAMNRPGAKTYTCFGPGALQHNCPRPPLCVCVVRW